MVFEIGNNIRNGLVKVTEERYLESIILSVFVIFNEDNYRKNKISNHVRRCTIIYK